MEQVKRKLVIIIDTYYVRKYLFPILKWLWLLKYLNFLVLNIFIYMYTLYIFINDTPFTGCFKFNAIGKIYIFSPKTNCREDNKVAILWYK